MWADDIEHALRRSASPFTVTHVISWLREGRASMFIAPQMHGSVVFWDDGTAEVGHISGTWNADDATWLINKMRDTALERGVSFVKVNGRKGWQRFLQMKGVHTDGC